MPPFELSPFAEYRLTKKPDWLVTVLAGGDRIFLTEHCGHRVVCARDPSQLIYVEGSERLYKLGWGGTKNHGLHFANGQWEVQHYGHHGAILFNGEPLKKGHVLQSGDRVSPATGLEFTYVQRNELVPLLAAIPADTAPEAIGRWITWNTGMMSFESEIAARHIRWRQKQLANHATP